MENIALEIERIRKDNSPQVVQNFERAIKGLLDLCSDTQLEHQLSDLLSGSQSQDKFWEIIELLCRFRAPSSGQSYCYAELENGSQLTFSSISAPNSARDTRVPRTFSSDQACDLYTKHNVVYVIHHSYEARAWLIRWEGRALLAGRHLHELIEQYR